MPASLLPKPIFSVGAIAALRRQRWVAGPLFVALMVAACVLLGRRLTHSSWPLADARTLLVALAALSGVVVSLAFQRARPVA